jgi:hypothetical protein
MRRARIVHRIFATDLAGGTASAGSVGRRRATRQQRTGGNVAKDPYEGVFNLSGNILAANRAALLTARPWAWRRILDGLPVAPQPEAVIRPGQPFGLRLAVSAGEFHLHSPRDPDGEAARLVARSPIRNAEAVVVLGFGGGFLVERALAAAPTGCTVIAAVVDPGSFLVTLAHRELPALIADPRLALALGDLREISAALPKPPPLWLIHPPVLAAASPALAPLIEQARREPCATVAPWEVQLARRKSSE